MTSTAHYQQAFETSVEQIRSRFIARVEQQVAELDDLMERLETNPSDNAALEGATNLIHKIAGVAATLGFQKAGELAQSAESRLVACSKTPHGETHAQAMIAVESLIDELDQL